MTDQQPEWILDFNPSKFKQLNFPEMKQGDQEIHDLLDALKCMEDGIATLKSTTLHERFRVLRIKLEAVLQKQKEENIARQSDMQSLKKELENLKEEKVALEKKLAVAQVTWVWEAHLARFVVDHNEKIYQTGRFRQMQNYLKKIKSERDLWAEIQIKLVNWTDEHWMVIKDVRSERNSVAHPSFIDLEDLEQSELKNMSPSDREQMKDMFDILKMTASLMKFGRLATFYEENKDLFSTQGLPDEGLDADALKDMISWNRNFEDIGTLQMVKHQDAKSYLEKYLGDSQKSTPYFAIVDFLIQGYSKRLGKLAREYVDQFSLKKTGPESEVVNKLMKLLPNQEDEISIAAKECVIAKLLIPDFLSNRLWKVGIEIVEKVNEEKEHHENDCDSL